MKKRPTRQPNQEVVQNLAFVIHRNFMSQAKIMSAKTGLSTDYCYRLVARQVAKQKGLPAPVQAS